MSVIAMFQQLILGAAIQRVALTPIFIRIKLDRVPLLLDAIYKRDFAGYAIEVAC
jgi:hypothetical protein